MIEVRALSVLDTVDDTDPNRCVGCGAEKTHDFSPNRLDTSFFSAPVLITDDHEYLNLNDDGVIVVDAASVTWVSVCGNCARTMPTTPCEPLFFDADG